MRITWSFYICLLFLPAIASAQLDSKEEQAALTLVKEGKTDEALAAFRTIVKKDPRNQNALGAIARLSYDKGDYAAAYKTATQGLALNKTNTSIAITHAKAAIELGHPDEALTDLSEVLKREPKFAYAWWVRGRALDAKGQKQMAITSYTNCIQNDPAFSLAYYYRGDDFNNISRFADALKDFNTFITQQQDYAPAYNDRARANLELGHPDAAIADYSKSIELDPAFALAYSNRGTLYINTNQLELAKQDFKKAMSLDASNADSYYGLARVYNWEKNYAQALPLAEKSVALNPDMPVYYAVYATTLMGLDRDREAIPVTDKILSIDDHNTDGWMLKATAYSNISDFGNAILTLNNAIAKVPDNYLLYSLRAAVYRFQGNNAAATADDAKAKELSSK